MVQRESPLGNLLARFVGRFYKWLLVLGTVSLCFKPLYIFYEFSFNASYRDGTIITKNATERKFRDYHYEVTTTDFGWSTPDDLTWPRRLISSEFYKAVLAHPKFSSLAWTEVKRNPEKYPNRTLVVFMDVETCDENNYPVYGDWSYKGWKRNADVENGRNPGPDLPSYGYIKDLFETACKYILEAAQSPALKANPRNRLMVLDCGGWPHERWVANCPTRQPEFAKYVLSSSQVIFASFSQNTHVARQGIDIGLPTPSVKPVQLTVQERADIQNCKPRKYLFAFQGQPVAWRKRLMDLSNETDMYIRIIPQSKYQNDLKAGDPSVDHLDYKSVLTSAAFGGAPRGDDLYSYRFAETLSAGTIPVVYANDWVRPFHPNVVDWEKCAVFIREEDVNTTAEVLRKIPPEKVCEMQKYALQVWDEYVSSRTGWVNGLVKSALLSAGI